MTRSGALDGPPSGGKAARAVVLIVTVATTGVVPFRVRVEGDTVHVAALGAPEQARPTEPLNPDVPARFSE